jgi:hypothetical protein
MEGVTELLKLEGLDRTALRAGLDAPGLKPFALQAGFRGLKATAPSLFVLRTNTVKQIPSGNDSKKGKGRFVLRTNLAQVSEARPGAPAAALVRLAFVIPTLRKMREGWGTRQVF